MNSEATTEPSAEQPTALARKFPIILFLLLLVATFVRVYDLGNLPPGIFRDEAEKGLTALRIAQSGTDLNGKSFPIFTQVFGVTTSMIYQYTAMPGVALFGLNEWTTRLPAAVVGIATLLINALYLRRAAGVAVALLATAMLAVSPWHVPFSRWAQQGIFLPLLMSIALYSWHRARTSHFAWHWVASLAACLALSMYAYDVARLFIPVVLVGAVLIHHGTLWQHRARVAFGFAVFLLVLLPVVLLLFTDTQAAQARFQRISVFGENRTIVQAMTLAAQNYFTHWSPQFLFVSGDAELRHGAGTGVLTALEGVGLLAFVGFGLYNRWLWKSGWFLGLLAFPLAASLTTVGIPHALRCIVALPLIQNAAALGIVLLIHRLSGRRQPLALIVAVLLAFASSFGFLRSYFGDYASRSALNWQYGLKSALAWMQPHRERLDRVTYVNFDGADRARLLVEFYGGLDAKRDDFAQFGTPPNVYAAPAPLRHAVLTLPGAPIERGGIVIPIHAPGTTDEVFAIYLNAAAWQAIAPIVTGSAPSPATSDAP